MTEPNRTNADPPTADRIRQDITRGKAGDKIDYPDPAAAPLGTDDEAAGKSPSAAELHIAAETAHLKPPEIRVFGVVYSYAAIVFAIIAVVLVVALSLR